uniref:SH3 domain containing 19 n=1 Tax=Gadus morhua TaxID=8049 RepID=A0A8C5A2L4_GADMO
LSAEPLANSSWFPGASGIFNSPPAPPPPPPAPESSWPGSPPPSYDQVIKEKTQEEHVSRPTAAPRRLACTSTSATQTDPVREDTSASPRLSPAIKKPQKPPRPSLLKTQCREPTIVKSEPTNIQCTNVSIEPVECPIPLPRLKKYHRKPLTEEVSVSVQTLVSLSDNVEDNQVNSSNNQEELSSNKYIEQLLEVFGADNSSLENDKASESNSTEQSTEADDKMSAMHSQREVSARIAAFETKPSTEEETAAQRPKPLPRNASIKPPVSSKPSIASRASFKHSRENNNNNNVMPPKPLVASRPQKPSPAPRPQHALQPGGYPSIGGPQDMMPSKGPVLPSARLSIKAKVKGLEQQLQQENCVLTPPVPGEKPFKEPLLPNLNLNNHNSTFMATEDQDYDSSSSKYLDSGFSGYQNKQSITRRPTTIRPNSMTSRSEFPIILNLFDLRMNYELENSEEPGGGKVLPPRPPPAKVGPARPPQPGHSAPGRASLGPASQRGAQSAAPVQRPGRRGPALPPRPRPGHRLYNQYTVRDITTGVYSYTCQRTITQDLCFKNDVLLLLEEMDQRTVMCQVGEGKGLVQRCHMKVITPLAPQEAPQIPNQASSSEGGGLQVQAIHDFDPAGPEELGLRAGDVAIMVEQVDNDWYKGTCRGNTGFFPVNYVNVLSNSPLPSREKKPSATVSGPRCVARFDFEGEGGTELTFSEGDVISLMEYLGDEWAKGQLGAYTGVYPLNFVEVVEDLPLPPMTQQQPQTRIALPGRNRLAPQPSGPEWVVALYDFNGQTGEDLSFKQGDRILVTKHLDTVWWSGRLNGYEGIFPSAFVGGSPGTDMRKWS